jgi:hypothetical protein
MRKTQDRAHSSIKQYWCQRRDSNSQTPVSKTGCYSNSHTLALWCTGEDLNLRVPLGETGLQPVRFGRAHAPVQTWRKVDESNAHRSSRCPGFQDQLPAIQRYLPHGGEYGVEPVSLSREPLFSRQVPYRPAHSPFEFSKNYGILVGPVGVEPTKGLLLRQLRMPVPPRA